MNSLGKKFRNANYNEMPALIYESDQFKIDTKKSRINIQNIGWIKIEDLNLDCNLKDIEWIAIECNEGVYSLMFSSIRNPFSETEENPMYIDGQVFGVPVYFKPNIFMRL